VIDFFAKVNRAYWRSLTRSRKILGTGGRAVGQVHAKNVGESATARRLCQ
jgi:hypothetical protein